MSKVPFFGQPHRVPSASFQDGSPISAYRALALRSDIQFYVDQIPQHRINWCTGLPGDIYDTFYVNTLGGPAERHVWAQEFELTYIRSDWPCALDMKVVGAMDTGGVMRVRVVPASKAFDDLSVPALFDDSVTSIGAGNYTIEGFYAPNYAGETPRSRDALVSMGVDEAGTARSVKIGLMRLEVSIAAPADRMSYILSVLVREWAWHHE